MSCGPTSLSDWGRYSKVIQVHFYSVRCWEESVQVIVEASLRLGGRLIPLCPTLSTFLTAYFSSVVSIKGRHTHTAQSVVSCHILTNSARARRQAFACADAAFELADPEETDVNVLKLASDGQGLLECRSQPHDDRSTGDCYSSLLAVRCYGMDRSRLDAAVTEWLRLE